MTQENGSPAAHELLAQFQQAVEDLGYPTRLVPAEEAEPAPGPLLLVGIERDQQERERILNLMVMPAAGGEDFNHLSLVQIYAPLPFTVNSAQRSRLAETLAEINNRTSAGYFGMTGTGAVFLRYVWIIPKFARLPVATVQQTLILFIYLLNIFALEIETAAGEAGSDDGN